MSINFNSETNTIPLPIPLKTSRSTFLLPINHYQTNNIPHNNNNKSNKEHSSSSSSLSQIPISTSNKKKGRNNKPENNNVKQISPEFHKTIYKFSNRHPFNQGDKHQSQSQSLAHQSNINQDNHQPRSSSLPKLSRNTKNNCNNNNNNSQSLFRSTSRIIQDFNQKNHFVNRKEAEILRKLYNEDQNFIRRLNKIKKDYNLALRSNFSSEWYQGLLVSTNADLIL